MNMPVILLGHAFPLIDVIALLWFLLCTLGYSLYADIFRNKSKDSIITVMNGYRYEWMRQMLTRENRIVDTTIVGNLVRAITFFASTSILIVAGLITMLGYSDQAVEVISALPFAVTTSVVMWEIKVLLLILIFTYAFFKYTWSLRTHNYTSIIIGAAPLPEDDLEEAEHFARRGAELSINAAKHFNLGVRGYYYGLATLAWFIHPLLFILSCSWVVYVSYRREFRSNALASLLR